MVVPMYEEGSINIFQISGGSYECDITGSEIEPYEPHFFINGSELIISEKGISKLYEDLSNIEDKKSIEYEKIEIKFVQDQHSQKCIVCKDYFIGDYIKISPLNNSRGSTIEYNCLSDFINNIEKSIEFYDEILVEKICEKVYICNDYVHDTNLGSTEYLFSNNEMNEGDVYINFFNHPVELSNISSLKETLVESTATVHFSKFVCSYCGEESKNEEYRSVSSLNKIHADCCEEIMEHIEEYIQENKDQIVANSIM